jgi:GNAT superfamily N-acetyltransferase
MASGPGVAIRPLTAADGPACDEVVDSLPYHFGNPDGRRECAEAVRSSAGLVAVRGGQVVGFLTVAHHFEAVSEVTWMAVHARHRGQGIGRALIHRLSGQLRDAGKRAFYRSVGFLPARELPDLWPGDKALLLAMPLDGPPV